MIAASVRSRTRRPLAVALAALVGVAALLVSVPADAAVVTSRLEGVDRYATSVDVAQYWDRFDPGNGVVYIANGLSFPDALSAAPAAAYQGGPLLLVGPNTLPTSVRDELTRLYPYTIKVIGGAISSAVEDDLLAYVQPSGDVIRIAGVDRYETSRLVVQQAFTGHSASYYNAFIATGVNFPDALAAAGAAGANKMPVILVNGGAESVDPATLSLIDTLNYTHINIAGGYGTVSSGIGSNLNAQPFVYDVERFGGVDRYDTGALINDYWFDDINPTSAYIANGLGFADALAGGARAGFTQSPLYTTDPNCLPRSVVDSLFGFGAISNVYLLGGPGSLSANIDGLVPCDELE